MQACADHPQVSAVANGRFKGGYITRHYGQPANHVHAIQLEMCQSLYMQEESPYDYDEALATRIQPVLRQMVASALETCGACYEK
jgi:N-formylglutamate deformylase